MNISKFVTSYLSEPFIIWAIFLSFITNLVFIPIFHDLVTWIVESQVYLAIFIPSLAFLYLKHTFPIYKARKEIRKAQHENRWVLPQIISDKLPLDMSLVLSAALFFSDLLMCFGALDNNAINNKEMYHKLQFILPIIGFGLVPGMSGYFSRRLENYFKKIDIKFCKHVDSETMIPIISLFFFGMLSYVAAVNIL